MADESVALPGSPLAEYLASVLPPAVSRPLVAARRVEHPTAACDATPRREWWWWWWWLWARLWVAERRFVRASVRRSHARLRASRFAFQSAAKQEEEEGEEDKTKESTAVTSLWVLEPAALLVLLLLWSLRACVGALLAVELARAVLLLLAHRAKHNVARWVAAHSRFLRSVTAAMRTLQEAELIRRGYRVSQPLAPISRLELATTRALVFPALRRLTRAELLGPSHTAAAAAAVGGAAAAIAAAPAPSLSSLRELRAEYLLARSRECASLLQQRFRLLVSSPPLRVRALMLSRAAQRLDEGVWRTLRNADADADTAPRHPHLWRPSSACDALLGALRTTSVRVALLAADGSTDVPTVAAQEVTRELQAALAAWETARHATDAEPRHPAEEAAAAAAAAEEEPPRRSSPPPQAEFLEAVSAAVPAGERGGVRSASLLVEVEPLCVAREHLAMVSELKGVLAHRGRRAGASQRGSAERPGTFP